jgi:hypothetical protein
MEKFKSVMDEIFCEHLKCEFWTEEDPDGKSGGCNITMSYEGDDWIIYVFEKDKYDFYVWCEKADDFVPYVLSEEEADYIENSLIHDIYCDAETEECMAGQSEMERNGMSWRDFI